MQDVAQQMKIVLGMFKCRLTLTFRHTISHPCSDQNDSFQVFFWDINKISRKDYVHSSQAILQAICTLLEQSYHYYNFVCKMKLTDDL